MKSIAYVIPYFGKLPDNFPLWLVSCEKNPTVDWLLFTDDNSDYTYPPNVKVTYMSFDELKERIQKLYNFPISLETGWKICDYRVAFGEIFEKELKEYDFWGHCDLDLMWGDIRHFLTDEILEKYEIVGYQGHSTLYRNNYEVNSRYKLYVDGVINYKDVFATQEGCTFDEKIFQVYDALNIDYYKETIFAHLNKYESSFYLGHLPKEDIYKNKRQVFYWKNGVLTRYYLDQNKIKQEDFMYIHFWCRPMTYKVKNCSSKDTFVIYPDVVKKYDKEIDVAFVKKHGHKGKIPFLLKTMYRNRKKITVKRILFNIKSFSSYRQRDVR